MHDQMIERVHSAIKAIEKGQMVIMTDDESRENEGDFVFAAEDVTSDKINFMLKKARGLVCLALSSNIIDKLKLPMMTDPTKAHPKLGTAFTVSIEAKKGISTGISAQDRAHTIKVAIDENSTPEDIVVPGHMFPLKAKDGGVLERTGHTEGAVDLAHLAGKKKAAVICEIMNEDGSMARRDDLERLSKEFEIPMISIEDLIHFRMLKESLIEEVKRANVSTSYGDFTGVWLKSKIDMCIHFALMKGSSFDNSCVDVRVHRESPIEDVFLNTAAEKNRQTEGRWKIDYALRMLAEKDKAVVLYLKNQETDSFLSGFSKNSIDPRYLGIGAQILKFLDIHKMNLHTTSKKSLVGLGGFGLQIEQMIYMNEGYKDAK